MTPNSNCPECGGKGYTESIDGDIKCGTCRDTTNEPMNNTQSKVLFRTTIAGLKFHEAWNILEPVYQNTIATLVPEPDNKYDPNAIKVLGYDGKMLGYISKDKTELIHKQWAHSPCALVILHQPKVIVIDVLVYGDSN